MNTLATLLVLLVQLPAQRPAQIILFRHAEKPADAANPHLSPAGVQRAAKLPAAMAKFGTPAVIFATKTTKDDDGQRTQETVAPLAAALKLTVQTPFLGKEYRKLAKQILGNPAYAGKIVYICWNHEAIPQLAAALGVTPQPKPWKGKEFDRVYVISYKGKQATVTVSAENLGGSN